MKSASGEPLHFDCPHGSDGLPIMLQSGQRAQALLIYATQIEFGRSRRGPLRQMGAKAPSVFIPVYGKLFQMPSARSCCKPERNASWLSDVTSFRLRVLASMAKSMSATYTTHLAFGCSFPESSHTPFRSTLLSEPLPVPLRYCRHSGLRTTGASSGTISEWTRKPNWKCVALTDA